MASGGEIKRLRTSTKDNKKKSVAEVAGWIGVDAERLRKWEQRNADPSDSSDIEKVESYFGVPIHKLSELESFQFYTPKNNEKDDCKEKYIKLLEKQVNTFEQLVTSVEKSLKKIEQRQTTIARFQSQADEAILGFVAEQKKMDKSLFVAEVYNKSSLVQDLLSGLADSRNGNS